MIGPVAQVVVVPLEGGVPPMSVQSRQAFPSGADEWTPACETVWREQLEESDRLHDGPIWSVVELSPRQLVVRAERYKRLCVQSDGRVGDLGVRVLGVKGLLTGQDRAGTQRVLIARRGSGTRIYQGLWELAPAGGVDVRAALSTESVNATLRSELREELGEHAAEVCASVTPAFVAAVIDPIALSVDLLASVAWPEAVDQRAGLCADASCAWEYVDMAWVSRADLDAMIASAPGGAANAHAVLSPPTLAVLRWMGWVGGDQRGA